MVYLSDFFITFSPDSRSFTDYKTIPTGCKIIGIAFYNNDIKQHQHIINELATKTEVLLVYFSEPTVPEIVKFIETNTNSNIKFFSDVVVNLDSPKTKTAISWFIFSTNFYAIESWGSPLLKQLTHNNFKPKKFDCLLGSSKPHRDLIEQLYLNSTYRDQIIFSYFKKNIRNGVWDYNINEVQESHERIVYSDISVPASAIIPVSIYNQSYYSIVAETTADNSYSQFTEKIAKPIVARRLFVCFNGQHYLRNLKSLGFKTFDNVIDESYDTIENEHERFKQAWAQVEYLCTQDPGSIISQIRDTLEHNYQHFLSTDWHSEIKKYLTVKC